MAPDRSGAHLAALAALEVDLAEERAGALFRAGKVLDDAHARCRASLARLDARPDDAELLAQYRSARQVFLDVRWAYTVQREALGLWDHRWVDRTCPTPPRR